MNVDSKDKPWKRVNTSQTRPAPGTNLILPALTAALTALQTIVVAGFGYVLTGKLELTLKERQLTVVNVNAMAELVKAMYADGANEASRKRTVQHLAMYQRDAIGPLLILAAGQNPFPAEIPLEGLRFVALQYQADVCSAVSKTIATRDIVFDRNQAPIEKLHAALCQG